MTHDKTNKPANTDAAPQDEESETKSWVYDPYVGGVVPPDEVSAPWLRAYAEPPPSESFLDEDTRESVDPSDNPEDEDSDDDSKPFHDNDIPF